MPFSSCTAVLGLHAATAWILDEMAFLINAVLALASDAPDDEIQKVQATAKWIHSRIEQLPADSPNAPSRSHGSTTSRSSPESEDDSAAGVDFFDPIVPQAADEPAEQPPPRPHSLLPRYPELEATRRLAPAPASTPALASSAISAPGPGADYLYRAVRLSGMLWARAIHTRQPLSAICSAADALPIFAACWRIPLAGWRRVMGIFVFIVMILIPTANKAGDDGPIKVRVHTRFAKSILQIGLMQASIESWPLCREMTNRALGLQKWLREGPRHDIQDGGIRR